MRIGRNDPCVCGSGKKSKKCCGVTITHEPTLGSGSVMATIPLRDWNAPEVGARPGSIIVKVQTPLNGPGPAVVYDRERAYQGFVDLSEDMHARMAGRPKSFFYAELKFNQPVFGDEAPAQAW